MPAYQTRAGVLTRLFGSTGAAHVPPAADSFKYGDVLTLDNVGAGSLGAQANGFAPLGGMSVHVGDYICETPGEVIRNKRITGRLINRTYDVVGENVQVEIGDYRGSGYGIDMTHPAARNFYGRFITISPSVANGYVQGIGVKEFTLERSLIEDVGDGVRIYTATGVRTNATLRAVWIRRSLLLTPDLAYSGTRADDKTHADQIQIQGGDGTLIEYCQLDGMAATEADAGPLSTAQSYVVNTTATSPFPPTTPPDGVPHPQTLSAIMLTPDVGQITNLIVRFNDLGGGEITINGGSSKNTGLTGRIENNRFRKNTFQNTSGQPYATNGGSVPSIILDPVVSSTAMVVVGNTYVEDGSPVVRRNG